MTMVAVKNGTLFTRVDRAERKDAPWIILSNSLAADHTMWDPQIPLLTSGYHVLRYDTRGHGGSGAPDGPYSFDMLIDDVLAVLDHYGVSRATMMGLSLGGMTGLGLALRDPGRLVSLVCCDARADAPEPFVKSWNDRIALIKDGGVRTILDATMERWLTARTRTSDPALASRVQKMILKTAPGGYLGCAAALKQLDYLKGLGAIAVPVLYVCGSEDAGAPPQVMKQMAERTPGSRFAVVPDSAHIANLDNPIGFNAAIAPFLGLKA